MGYRQYYRLSGSPQKASFYWHVVVSGQVGFPTACADGGAPDISSIITAASNINVFFTM